MSTGAIVLRRCRRGASLLLPLLALAPASSGLVMPVGRAAVAFIVPSATGGPMADAAPLVGLPSFLDGGAAHGASLLLSDEASGGGGVDILGTVGGVLGVALLLAIAIFATAKITLKPELAEGAKMVRQEERTLGIIALLKDQRNGGGDMAVLVEPLEKTLGMSVREYVASVDDKSSEDVLDAEKELAALLRTVYL